MPRVEQGGAQADRVQRWLPWKVALVLLGVTLLVNTGVTW
jgi:hypothetical protein